MAGEYIGGSGGLNVGNLTISLNLEMGKVFKQVEETNARLKSIASVTESMAKAAGGSLGMLGERFGQLNNAMKKAFGDGAPALMQQFGRDIQRATGLTDSAIKGLSQSASALEGVFKTAGLAVSTLLSPLGAVLAAALGIAAAIGAVKNAMDALKGSGGGSGLAQQYQSNKQWVMDNVPGAQWAAGALSWAGDRAKSDWNRAANTPGSFVETVDKMDVAGDLKAAFGRVAKDLESVLGPVMKMLQPGTSAADKAKSAAERAKGSEKLMSAFDKINAEFDENLSEQLEYLADMELKAASEAAEREKQIKAQQLDDYEQQMRDFNDELARVQDEQIRAENERLDRWASLGGGQIGTFAGIGGMGGVALNIVGGAASQYENTGSALQGAAVGGQAGGPWGAVIGAIIALATKTEAFSKIMSGIEGVLGKLINAIGRALDPVVESLSGIFNFVEQIVDVVGGVLDGINQLVNTQGLGQSIGSADDQWGKYSVNDWLMLTPVFTELGNEIEKLLGSPTSGGYSGPSGTAMNMMAAQEQARRDAWDLDPRNPYYALNMQAKALADIEAAQIEAKQSETREAERAADALRELADSVTNAVAGYKIEGAMFRAADSVTRDPAAGNPFA